MWTGTLTLDGELAATLVHGGPYEHFTGSPTEAKRLGLAFVDALVGERHDDFKAYRSHQARAPWFYNIAWDVTRYSSTRGTARCPCCASRTPIDSALPAQPREFPQAGWPPNGQMLTAVRISWRCREPVGRGSG
jgi:hypothetical protein